MNLAVVGSRHYTDYASFCKILNSWIDKNGIPDTIVSGGAKGADALAKRFAKEKNITLVEYEADWERYGKSAGPRRNTLIVNAATHMIAFPSHTGRGTQNSIKKAEEKIGKALVHVVYVD